MLITLILSAVGIVSLKQRAKRRRQAKDETKQQAHGSEMSKTVQISSAKQFESLLSSSKVVVSDFYADWCPPCKAIAPHYETLSQQLSRPNLVTFAKINVEKHKDVARTHQVSVMPTFMIFKDAVNVQIIQGADLNKLSATIKKLAAEVDSAGTASGSGDTSSSGANGSWLGADLPKGYADVSDQVDSRGLDLLNADSDFGNVKTLFEGKKPSALKRAATRGAKDQDGDAKDWVISDTDEQLMLFIPFQSTLKIHSLHITSTRPPKASGDDAGDDDVPMRPKTIKIYTNRPSTLGFEEADDIPPTQSLELKAFDWDDKTGTAKIELRFVKFQNVSSLVVFVVDGDGDGDKVRVDRVRIIGEAGEKKDLGKLEKKGHDAD